MSKKPSRTKAPAANLKLNKTTLKDLQSNKTVKGGMIPQTARTACGGKSICWCND